MFDKGQERTKGAVQIRSDRGNTLPNAASADTTAGPTPTTTSHEATRVLLLRDPSRQRRHIRHHR